MAITISLENRPFLADFAVSRGNFLVLGCSPFLSKQTPFDFPLLCPLRKIITNILLIFTASIVFEVVTLGFSITISRFRREEGNI